MARYGRDFDRNRGGMTGRRGGMGDRDFNAGYAPGAYGGMRSDAQTGWEESDVAYRGGLGWGGGTYDVDYNAGMGRRGGMAGGYGAGGYEEGRAWGRMGQTRGRMRAADIMTDNPETVTPDATLADAAKKMRDLNVGIIPVVDSEQGRRLRGVVTDRDIAVRAVAEGMDVNSTKVSDVMTSGVESCNKNDPVDNVLDVMSREQVRRVPITDREGRLVGIIAEADVLTDYAEGNRAREDRVEDTLENVYEPGRPRRGGMRAGGRGGRGME